MSHDVERKAGLSHCRASADNNEAARLQSRSEFVEIDETSWRSGNGIASVIQRLDVIEGFAQ